jgi:hypothetical protein
MKKELAVFVVFSACFFLCHGISFSWQGRMAGMGDPFGLIEDESDLLINPAKIADGQGVKYFGDFRFTYGNVTDWEFNARQKVNGPASLPSFGLRNAPGNEYDYDTLLGTAFPLGAGRMGVFFGYSGKRSDFEGQSTYSRPSPFSPVPSSFGLNSDLDNFALRVIYGQPLGDSFKIGGEIQIAYRSEENRLTRNGPSLSSAVPDFIENNGISPDMLTYMLPYDSQYWEILFKTGIEGNWGPAKVGLAVRGGPIFSGNNDWSSHTPVSAGEIDTRFDMKGEVGGWKAGGDLWVRYSYSDDLSIPLSLRVDFSDKSRSGNGTGTGLLFIINEPFFPGWVNAGSPTSILGYTFDSRESALQIEAGGGMDAIISKNWRVAAGLYYDYIKTTTDLSFASFDPHLGISLDDIDLSGFPDRTEHLAKFKLAAETRVNPAWVLRGGLDVFGGFASENYSSDIYSSEYAFRGSLDGTHWGITGYFGATTNWDGITLEPFLQAGYEELNLSDPTARSSNLAEALWSVENTRNEAVVGAGISILF